MSLAFMVRVFARTAKQSFLEFAPLSSFKQTFVSPIVYKGNLPKKDIFEIYHAGFYRTDHDPPARG